MNNIMPAPGTRDGNWIWDGTRWVCQPDCDFDDQPCPPFSVLQPGGRHHSPFFPPPVTQPPWYPGANGGVSFAPPGQPPPNPIRGAFWWDGTSLWVFDGAAWDVVGAGSGTVVTPPGSTFPKNPAPGEQFFDGKILWIWDGNAWVPVSQTKTSVQATAPPNPNPGDLWFDGTQLHIWSGSAWSLVGPGATVGPVPTTTLQFAINQPTTISGMTPNAFMITPLNATPTVDVQNAWDGISHKYTPKVAGNYMFFTQQYEGGAETGASHMLLFNDSGTWVQGSNNVVLAQGFAASGGVGLYLTGSGIKHMNGTTDFVRLFSFSSDGTFYPLTPNNPVFHAWLLP